MRSTRLTRAVPLALLTSLALPSLALAQDEEPAASQVLGQLDLTWVIVATCLVFFMQAGFLLLEIGFSRGKNAGMGVAKILVNFSIASIAWWAVGFAFAFGGAEKFLGTDSGFFAGFGHDMSGLAGDLYGETFTGGTAAFMVFQFMFAAVSLAIVWGTTLERMKFTAYIPFAIVFSAIIYPLIAHWGFGGGFFSATNFVGNGIQDFAGSSVVHLTGATAALAAVLFLGPRKGKYGPDGKPRAIPGHNMPLFGLGVVILWLGWFGFNGGSTLGTGDGRFAEVVMVTNLGAAGGVIGAMLLTQIFLKTLDVGFIGNGAIAGLVAITAPSGYVEFWAAPIIGLIGGFIVVGGVLAFDRMRVDDPVGALSAHGLAGIWGTLACGFFTSDRLAETVGVGDPGLFYGGGLTQLGVQALAVVATFVVVFTLSAVTFAIIKATIGLRVADEDEVAGLDISEHGMYGYPEQFIPQSELEGYGAAPTVRSPAPAYSTQEVPAT
ncbi:MAG TPA: ammonium transporter [Solirubrobacteraceae bacterium]|nr:ammonium transporter [Solirubrobacteraceae bacterium]